MPIVQAKLRVGTPNDKYEQQADRIADEVMHMPELEVDGQRSPPALFASRESVQRKCTACGSAGGLCPECEEKLHGLPEGSEDAAMQRKAPRTGSNIAQHTAVASRPFTSASVENVLRSPGRPLEGATRAFFEPRLGHDFGQVRVHSGGLAARAASAVHAQAFTVGRDVVFGAGEYAPEKTSGRRLLAHELTHVVQQNHSTPSIMKFGLGLGLGGCTVPPEECRHPTGYSIGPGTRVRDLERFGMEESPRIIEGESLNQVFVKELITQEINYYSFLSWDEMESESDPYLNAADMPADAHLFPTARALNGYDKYVQENGPMKGTISFLQMYIYIMPKCGLTKPRTLPNSGYRITHTLETGINGEVVATTSKRAESVKIRYESEDYETNAGLTQRIRPVKNQLRP